MRSRRSTVRNESGGSSPGFSLSFVRRDDCGRKDLRPLLTYYGGQQGSFAVLLTASRRMSATRKTQILGRERNRGNGSSPWRFNRQRLIATRARTLAVPWSARAIFACGRHPQRPSRGGGFFGSDGGDGAFEGGSASHNSAAFGNGGGGASGGAITAYGGGPANAAACNRQAAGSFGPRGSAPCIASHAAATRRVPRVDAGSEDLARKKCYG